MLGYALPKSLLGANESNPVGHWESTEVIALNEEVLESAGSRWDDWTPFNTGWYETPLGADYLQRARELIRTEFADQSMFVLKDPRLCRIAPLWLAALDEEGVETRVVLPVRHPVEVAGSLNKRDHVRMEYGKLLWLRYVLDAENGSRDRKRFFLTYDQLLADWPSVMERMADQLGWPWARSSGEVNQAIDGFLSPKLRSQVLREIGTREHDAWTRSTFQVLGRWSEKGPDAEGLALLDEIRESFGKAAPTFAGLLIPATDSRTDGPGTEGVTQPAHEADAQPHADGLAAAASPDEAAAAAETGDGPEPQPVESPESPAADNGQELRAELMTLIDGIRSAHDELSAQAERRAERLAGDLAAGEQKIAELESNLRQRQEENAQAWQELEREKAAREAAERKAADLKEADLRVESLTRLLKDAEAKEEQLTSELRELKGQVEALRSDLAEKDDALAAAGDQEQMSKRTAAILQSEREEALQRVASAEYRLAAAKSEIGGLTEKLETVEGLKAAAEGNLKAAEENIDERFAELASLSRILIEEENQRKRLETQSRWLRQVNEVVLRKGKWWWQLMPRQWQQRMRLRAVARAGLFDADAYVRAYPDVARSGQDPLRHYVAHGLDENRQF